MDSTRNYRRSILAKHNFQLSIQDQNPYTVAQAKNVRDLTKTIKQIDIEDRKRKENETQMKTTDGKICRFTEP